MSRRRSPTGEELELWEKVTETVEPLVRPRPVGARDKPKPSAAAKDAAAAKRTHHPPASAPAKRPVRKPPEGPSLHAFDRRTLSRIGRGTVAIDARIDLHGMTQDAAQARLARFLEDAQARGARVVLVITGKGRAGAGEERGVLRRIVPHWLAGPKLRPLVVGFDEAGPAHGGAGALYVRIRKAGRG